MIDCLPIAVGTQQRATEMIETPQEVMQGGADVPERSIVRKGGFPTPQDVLTSISTIYLERKQKASNTRAV